MIQVICTKQEACPPEFDPQYSYQDHGTPDTVGF